MIKRILVWTVEVVVPGAIGGIVTLVLFALGDPVEQDPSLSSSGPPIDLVWSVFQAVALLAVTLLVFLFVAKVWIREEGSSKGMLGGALVGVVLFVILGLIFSSLSIVFGDEILLPLALPAVGATIGYNLGPRPVTDDSDS